MKPGTVESLQHFVDSHEDAKLTGFYWYDGDYRVVVLAAAEVEGRRRKSEAVEFVGETAQQLVDAAHAAGFELGDAQTVQQNCESAGRSVERRPSAQS